MADEESIAYDLQDEFESKAKGFGKGKYGRIPKMPTRPLARRTPRRCTSPESGSSSSVLSVSRSGG